MLMDYLLLIYYVGMINVKVIKYWFIKNSMVNVISYYVMMIIYEFILFIIMLIIIMSFMMMVKLIKM